jgi:stage II sporulation protein D
MDSESQFWVRILLLDNVRTCIFKNPCPFSVMTDQNDMQIQNQETRIELTDITFGIELIDSKIVVGDQLFESEQITIFPDEPHVFNLNGEDYRGLLKLIINPEKGSFDVINILPIEPYLAGVVGAEMPDYWEPEALKAQAIAARTYCLFTKNRFGKNRSWDLNKTAAHQVYRGISAESTQVWNAVNQTKGEVLICEQDDTEDIFPAYYSSTCGGHTENSRNVFGDFYKPLRGVPCPYCRDVAKTKFFFWPAVMLDSIEIRNRLTSNYTQLNELGEIANIAVAEKSDYGKFSRITKIELYGSTGKTDFLRAEDFRLTLDPTGSKIKSMVCEIKKINDRWAFLSGRGWGHGVGMCQCGAEGMARKGKNAKQILEYYYPDSKILTIDY